MKQRARDHVVINIQQEIDSAFSELIHERWRSVEEAQWFPAVDIYDENDAYVLVADLPGVAPGGVNLTVTEKEVILCGSRIASVETASGRQLTTERISGRFCRSFHLAHPVEESAIETKWDSGVFLAILPKKKHTD